MDLFSIKKGNKMMLDVFFVILHIKAFLKQD